jgi:hypothetical protein
MRVGRGGSFPFIERWCGTARGKSSDLPQDNLLGFALLWLPSIEPRKRKHKGGSMLEKLKNLPNEIEGVKAIGKVSKEDYEQVFAPFLEEARRQGRRIRFLYQLGPEFGSFTPGAAWEDAKIGLHFMRLFDGCAVVTDLDWIREATRLVGFFMPCPVRVFGNQ